MAGFDTTLFLFFLFFVPLFLIYRIRLDRLIKYILVFFFIYSTIFLAIPLDYFYSGHFKDYNMHS